MEAVFKRHGVRTWEEARALKGDAYVAFWGDLYDSANWPEEDTVEIFRACGECGGQIHSNENRAYFDLADGSYYFTHQRCAHARARIVRPALKVRVQQWWRELWAKQD